MVDRRKRRVATETVVLQGAKDERPAVRTRVLLLSDDLSVQGGIKTRILGELAVVSRDITIHVIAKVRARNLQRIRKTRDEMRSLFPGIEVRFVPILPHGGLPFLKEAFTFLNAFILFLAANLAESSKWFSSVYAHNLDCALAGTMLCGVSGLPLTVDFHGDEVEENISINGWKRGGLRERCWRGLMRYVIERVQTVVCVSEAHREFLKTKYGLSTSTVVVPCCVSNRLGDPEAYSTELAARIGLCDKKGIWLFFSGSPFEWQLFDRMGEFFATLSRSRAGCHFLLLISERSSISSIQRTMSKFDVKGVQFESVPHDQLHSFASRTDIALLFREDVPLNNIASPTKFAEYLRAGLPVLLTPNIGDYSKLVVRERLGTTIDLTRISDLGYVSSVIDEVLSDIAIKKRCTEYVTAHLTWESYRDSLHRAFVGSGIV
jgi:hypothetical protein